MEERRQLVRHQLELPIEFPHGTGVTRNLNVAGVYFESPASFELFTPFSFSIVFGGTSNHPLRLHCLGTVVRIEPRDGACGVAATIDSFWLDQHEN